MGSPFGRGHSRSLTSSSVSGIVTGVSSVQGGWQMVIRALNTLRRLRNGVITRQSFKRARKGDVRPYLGVASHARI